MTILHIGPISYVGGVSVHILRLSDLLKNQTTLFECYFIDESPLQYSKKEEINIRRLGDFFKFANAIRKSDIVHIHSVHWLIRIYNILFAIFLRKPFIVTLHSFRVDGIKKAITLVLLRKAKKVIAVSEEIEAIVHQRKINTQIKEAFIPPILGSELNLPHEIEERIKIEKEKNILISANAFRLTPHKGGELYGLDQCIEVAIKAKEDRLNILIIFVIGTIRKSDDLYLLFKKRIEEFKLDEYIWIIPHQISFVRLINYSSIVLRPTLSDGDALTIRESIYLNKTIIASDVVKRPLGTITYKTGSVNDLYEKILTCINTMPQLNESITDNSIKYFNFYYNLYSTCTNLPRS